MALGLWVEAPESVSGRLKTAVDRAFSPEPRTGYDSDALFSRRFVRRHTEFGSLEEFCRAAPSRRDTIGGVQRLPPDERDDFVAARTEFETWSEMKEGAAVADAVTVARG